MKVINIIIACMMLFSTFQAYANEPYKTGASDTNAHIVVVSTKSAQFWFPVANVNSTWTWGISDPCICEYSWMVKVYTGTDEYEFGYSKFSGRSGKRNGTLSDLVASGQNDLWRYDPKEQSATVLCPRPKLLRTLVKGGGLLIELNDEEWIKRMFGTKPKLIEFHIRGVLQKHELLRVPIKYMNEKQHVNNAK